MNLVRLRQTLNYESHGGHIDNGYCALLMLINTIDDIIVSLEEQETWVRDGFHISEGQALNYVDSHVQLILSTILSNTVTLGEDYLVQQLCDDDQGYRTMMEAFKRWKDKRESAAVTGDALGDLDDHPF